MSKLTCVSIVSLVLYGILGIALGISGVLIRENFWHFMLIVFIVSIIDSVAVYKGKLRESIARGHGEDVA